MFYNHFYYDDKVTRVTTISEIVDSPNNTIFYKDTGEIYKKFDTFLNKKEKFTAEDEVSSLEDRFNNLEQRINKMELPVGSIFEITGDSRNPNIMFGYGLWESFGDGVSLVGVGSHRDDRGETKSWVDGDTEGEYNHKQTESEMARHDHTDDFRATTNSDSHRHAQNPQTTLASPRGWTDPTSGSPSGSAGGYTDYDSHNHVVNVYGSVKYAGWGSAMNITQPSLAVYRWKRKY